MLIVNKDIISPVKSFELLTAGYGIPATSLKFTKDKFLPSKWFVLSWSLEPPQLANTALVPPPEHISCFAPGYLRSSSDGLRRRLVASRKG